MTPEFTVPEEQPKPQMRYSYNPENITELGMDRMRFELGDTTFAPGELTAALSDAEYEAVISQHRSWKKAKLACLSAILMKYSHQTNMRVGPVSYDFAERVEFWKKLYDDLKAESNASGPGLSSASPSSKDGKPYFYEDMHANPYKE